MHQKNPMANNTELIGALVEIITVEDKDSPLDCGFIVKEIVDENELIVESATKKPFRINKSEIIKIYPRDPDNEGEYIGL